MENLNATLYTPDGRAWCALSAQEQHRFLQQLEQAVNRAWNTPAVASEHSLKK